MIYLVLVCSRKYVRYQRESELRSGEGSRFVEGSSLATSLDLGNILLNYLILCPKIC